MLVRERERQPVRDWNPNVRSGMRNENKVTDAGEAAGVLTAGAGLPARGELAAGSPPKELILNGPTEAII